MANKETLFNTYLSSHYAHIGDQSRYREGKKRQLAYTYKNLLPTAKNARILDIGPGYGQLMELLSIDLGYTQVCAIDVSQEVTNFCNNLIPGSTTLVTDTDEFLRANKENFDCIFLLHVLEHIPKTDIFPLLGSIYNSLADEGRLILEVPNMANPFTGIDLRYADFTHEMGFTELSIRYALMNTGFTDIKVFEERLAHNGPKKLLLTLFRSLSKLMIKVMYKGYELSVPEVLSPSLCVTAVKQKTSNIGL